MYKDSSVLEHAFNRAFYYSKQRHYATYSELNIKI